MFVSEGFNCKTKQKNIQNKYRTREIRVTKTNFSFSRLLLQNNRITGGKQKWERKKTEKMMKF